MKNCAGDSASDAARRWPPKVSSSIDKVSFERSHMSTKSTIAVRSLCSPTLREMTPMRFCILLLLTACYFADDAVLAQQVRPKQRESYVPNELLVKVKPSVDLNALSTRLRAAADGGS